MKNTSLFGRIWGVIAPILIYTGITYLVTFVGVMMVMNNSWANGQFADMNAFMEAVIIESLELSLVYTAVSGLLSAPLLYMLYRRDIKKRTYTVDYSQLRPITLIYPVIAGIAACLAGNIVIYVSQLGAISESYDTVAEVLFSGSLVIQILGMVIVAPIVEELIFRGIIYQRIKNFSTVYTAAVVSAILFSFYHGNIVQGVYSFLLGLILVYIFEKYKTVIAPIIFHAAANLFSVVMVFVNVEMDTAIVLTASLLASLAVLYFMLKRISTDVNVVTIGKAQNDSNDPPHPDRYYRPEPKEPQKPEEKRKFSVEDYYPKSNDDE